MEEPRSQGKSDLEQRAEGVNSGRGFSPAVPLKESQHTVPSTKWPEGGAVLILGVGQSADSCSHLHLTILLYEKKHYVS